jgi:CheY-like chemotaxis protein
MAKSTVLLVDDEPDFLEIMGQTLESWGYGVARASNGKEAIEAVKKKPDAVILDYVMPDIDGITLLRKIRRLDKDIPVIMFTAKPETKAIKEAGELNITAFVPKLSPYVDTKANLKSALSMAFKKSQD